MKVELLTSIIALSSLSPSILLADDSEQIIIEKVEISKSTYLTLKTLTLLQVLRVDREDNTLKVDIDRLPNYLVKEINQNGDIEIDEESNEMIITESSMHILNKNKYLKNLSQSLGPDSVINNDFDVFLQRINKLENFDLREDLERYGRSLFS